MLVTKSHRVSTIDGKNCNFDNFLPHLFVYLINLSYLCSGNNNNNTAKVVNFSNLSK